MKRMTTKELLAESFKELTTAKAINKITIANITDNCGMAQATFYRHFKDKYDLISWIYVTDAQRIMCQIGTKGYMWRDTLTDAAKYFSENRSFAMNALNHTSGRDSFLNLLQKVNSELLCAEVRKKLMTDTIPSDILTMIKIYCYGTVQYTCEWLMNNLPISQEEYADVLEKCLPEPLRKYLY